MKSLLEILQSINNNVDYLNEEDLVGKGHLGSLDILNLITALEDKYDIDIPPTEINIDNFRSITSIEKLVDRLV